jgi:hypothetical protein
MTRPPEVCTPSSVLTVPAWKTTTSDKEYKCYDECKACMSILDGSSPTAMVFPFSKLPGYPEDAKTTEIANPCRVVIITESNRRSTQAYTRG